MKWCADEKIMDQILNPKPVKLVDEHGKVVWRREQNDVP